MVRPVVCAGYGSTAQSDHTQSCLARDVDRHPDRALAGCAQAGPAPLGCLLGLIRPAFLAARGMLWRLGCGLLLHDLELGDGLALPLAVRLVLRPCAVGPFAARRIADGATTSRARFGLTLGGGLPAVRLG